MVYIFSFDYANTLTKYTVRVKEDFALNIVHNVNVPYVVLGGDTKKNPKWPMYIAIVPRTNNLPGKVLNIMGTGLLIFSLLFEMCEMFYSV